MPSNLRITRDGRYKDVKDFGDNLSMGNQANPSMNTWRYIDGGVQSDNSNIPSAGQALNMPGVGQWDKQNVASGKTGIFNG